MGGGGGSGRPPSGKWGPQAQRIHNNYLLHATACAAQKTSLTITPFLTQPHTTSDPAATLLCALVMCNCTLAPHQDVSRLPISPSATPPSTKTSTPPPCIPRIHALSRTLGPPPQPHLRGPNKPHPHLLRRPLLLLLLRGWVCRVGPQLMSRRQRSRPLSASWPSLQDAGC